MAKETNGKLKKLANALKPLRLPFLVILVIWGLSGIAAVMFLTQWIYVTLILLLITGGIATIIDYQKEKEKKAGEQ